MKAFVWNADKNEQLIKERNISFEDIVVGIQQGNEIDVFDHPNQGRYPGQKISLVVVGDYVFLVPFVETDDEIFLKTIIPSRKATRQYLGEKDE